ncbi:hypothetical protein RFI_15027 [Reticulomyxa filosa]|uniref:Uncharacterized protein n=1 Tax=Reticulomyxa filosa TaxID=46433 RepID=X6NA34_RETFI|nr:hypothetical protein RFI_15027 [Reticulomyxa filosa]|eukprot:ETO22172.1 hypothetical protein RFI_15027 [Reticulomyxa filosa]
MFFEFCAPYVVAGICTMHPSLMASLLTYYFNSATVLSNKIQVAEDNLVNIRKRIEKEKSIANNEKLLNVVRTSLNDVDQWVNEERLVEQQLKQLDADKQHIEGTLLILLGRRIEDENARKTLNMKELLQNSQNAKVHKVELYLYKLIGDHEAIVNAYLNDPDMRLHVFDYLHNLYQDCCDAKAYAFLICICVLFHLYLLCSYDLNISFFFFSCFAISTQNKQTLHML